MEKTTFKQELNNWRHLYLIRRPLILFLLAYITGILIVHACGLLNWIPRLDPYHWAQKRVALTGVVVSPPDLRPKGSVYILEAETVRELSGSRKTSSVFGRVLIDVRGAAETFAEPGDRLRLLGTLQIPNNSRVPGTFDYRTYLKTKGIFTVLYAGHRSTKNLGPSNKHRLLQLGWKIRKRIFQSFRKNLSEEHTTVLSGLVIGNRPRFHPEIRRIFIESGTMHILVASGSNVAFVIALWFWLVRLVFRLNQKLSLLTALPCAWIYVLIVGADPPIFRAGVMATIGILAYLMSREDQSYHALSLAALALLIPNPNMIFDVGFQMSFVAVFGMIYTLPRLESFYGNASFFIRWSARILFATLAAQIWLTPVTTSIFKRFFPIGVVANIAVLPLSAVGLFSGFSLALIQEVQNFLPSLSILRDGVAMGNRFYLELLIGMVRFFANHPGISIWVSPPNWIWIFGFYLFLFCVMGFRKSPWSKLGTCTGAMLLFFGWAISGCKKAPIKELQVTWIDHGRSLSTLIETPAGEKILVNPGPLSPTNTSERTLLPYLTEKRIKKLDAIVVTKSNPDRVAGLKALTQPMGNPSVLVCATTYPSRWEIWKSSHPEIQIEFLFPNQQKNWGNVNLAVLDGSHAFETETPLIITFQNKTIVLSYILSLKSQREILARGVDGIDVLQSRFSERILWDNDFLSEHHPNLLVEAGYDSPTRPSRPPWDKPKLVIPQKSGIFEWKSL